MTLNQKPTGTASSIPAGLIISGIVGLLTTIVGSAVIALLVDKEYLDETKIGYGVMIMLLLASYLSSTTAWKKIKHRRVLICLSAGCILFGILLSITALFFGGQYSSVGETALLILCGSMLSAMSRSNKKKGHVYRKINKAHR